MPSIPIFEFFKISLSLGNFSLSFPFRLIIGCSCSIAFLETPFRTNSSLTCSMPILSSLSMATVISTILSPSPIISAMPLKILRLLIFTIEEILSLSNTSSII